MKFFLQITFSFLFIGTLFNLCAYQFWPNYQPIFYKSSIYSNKEELFILKARAAQIKKYAESNKFNYDLVNDSVVASGLVAHGSCDNGFQFNVSFSNKINSGCSCRGKFRVGKSYNGSFGLAYKLFGLDPNNSNAFERAIVLHSYSCIPDRVTYPLPICNSRGCPMVSKSFLQKLKSHIDVSGKPIILEIFN